MTVTSATLTTPRLSEVARHLIVPEGITTSVFPRVYRRLRQAGIEFDRWQEGFGQVALGCRADGKFAATVGGVVASWPRQVGKTFTVGNLLIGLCLEFPGFRAVWTSHHGRTTTNTFRSMQAMVKRPQIAPFLRPDRSNGIRTANGEQEIHFANGSVIMFGAREQGFGRGMDAIDCEVFDEAQILSIKALEDMVPATNAAKNPHGGILFFIGTPPRPYDEGEAFTFKRKQALDGKTTDQVYCEFSADPDADPHDQEQWPVFNPSHPRRTPVEAMLRMLENIPDEDSRRREMMGIWPADNADAVITAEQWRACEDTESTAGDPIAIGVYVNLPRTRAAIAIAGRREDGRAHVEIVPAVRGKDIDMLPGTGWIPGRLAELVESWDPCAVVIDGRSAAASLIPEIEAAGVSVTVTHAGDMAKACGQFYDAVIEDGLRHRGSRPLAEAVVSAKRRPLGDAWAWDRKDKTSDITQLVATTLALHGLVVNGDKETEIWGFFE